MNRLFKFNNKLQSITSIFLIQFEILILLFTLFLVISFHYFVIISNF